MKKKTTLVSLKRRIATLTKTVEMFETGVNKLSERMGDAAEVYTHMELCRDRDAIVGRLEALEASDSTRLSWITKRLEVLEATSEFVGKLACRVAALESAKAFVGKAAAKPEEVKADPKPETQTSYEVLAWQLSHSEPMYVQELRDKIAALEKANQDPLVPQVFQQKLDELKVYINSVASRTDANGWLRRYLMMNLYQSTFTHEDRENCVNEILDRMTTVPAVKP